MVKNPVLGLLENRGYGWMPGNELPVQGRMLGHERGQVTAGYEQLAGIKGSYFGLGGQATAIEILKINAKARIIVSSGYANDPVLANYEAYGFTGIVVKPYHFWELQDAVHRALHTDS